MPIRKEAFTLRGGCQCQAVLYKIDVPQHDERPITPYRTPGADVGDARIPAVVVCHCPDCRRATSAVPAMAIITQMCTVRVSLAPQPCMSVGSLDRAQADDDFVDAAPYFELDSTARDSTFLCCYKSSPQRSRWFCSQCGTPIAYTIDPGVIPAEWGWPRMLDLWLGTLLSEDLQSQDMKPERMLWCEKAIPWVAVWARSGAGGIPEHPLTKIDKIMGDTQAGHFFEMEPFFKCREHWKQG